jgi:hypothetical protein
MRVVCAGLLIIIDTPIAIAGWYTLFVAGRGWLFPRDPGAASAAAATRILSLPIVWLGLYVVFAGYACDRGCTLADATAKVLSVVAVSSAVPLASTALLIRAWSPRVVRPSMPVSA